MNSPISRRTLLQGAALATSQIPVQKLAAANPKPNVIVILLTIWVCMILVF